MEIRKSGQISAALNRARMNQRWPYFFENRLKLRQELSVLSRRSTATDAFRRHYRLNATGKLRGMGRCEVPRPHFVPCEGQFFQDSPVVDGIVVGQVKNPHA